jgi:hypothetical protein
VVLLKHKILDLRVLSNRGLEFFGGAEVEDLGQRTPALGSWLCGNWKAEVVRNLVDLARVRVLSSTRSAISGVGRALAISLEKDARFADAIDIARSFVGINMS